MNDLIDQIKTRLPILEAAQRYAGVDLERKGNYYWCRCIHHQEKTPSMRINPDTDKFRCYACHIYGDTIDLVAEATGMTNSEAIEYLAKDLGLSGELTKQEREQLAKEQLTRQQERQKRQEQENSINQEYNRLIDIEKLMYFFLSGLKEETDLDRFEIICSLKNKDQLEDWINTLIYGDTEEKLAVVEASREWSPWKE